MAITIEEARAALAAKAGAEADLARIALCPPWRHAAFAAVETALVASPLVSTVGQFGILAAVFAGLVLIMQSDRRRLGVFINGYRRGQTRKVALVLMVAVLGLFGLSTWGTIGGAGRWISTVCALVTFPVCYYGSMIWQRVFRRELGV